MMNFIVRPRYSLIVPRKLDRQVGSGRDGPELLERQEEVEGDGQHDVEGEGAADQEQDRRGDQERQERMLLLPVETGRHEAPKLVGDHRKGEDEAAEHRNPHLGHKALLEPGEDKLRLLPMRDQEAGDGRGEEVEDRTRDGEGEDHCHREGEDREHDPVCAAPPGARSAARSSRRSRRASPSSWRLVRGGLGLGRCGRRVRHDRGRHPAGRLRRRGLVERAALRTRLSAYLRASS
jgi:hypothetical protein